MKPINDWARDAHELALERGDWDREREEMEIFACCHGDLAAALNEIRACKPMLYCEALCLRPCPECDMLTGKCDSANRQSRPMGAAAECARVILRLLDYLGAMQVDVEGVMRAVYEHDARAWAQVKYGEPVYVNRKA